MIDPAGGRTILLDKTRVNADRGTSMLHAEQTADNRCEHDKHNGEREECKHDTLDADASQHFVHISAQI